MNFGKSKNKMAVINGSHKFYINNDIIDELKYVIKKQMF